MRDVLSLSPTAAPFSRPMGGVLAALLAFLLIALAAAPSSAAAGAADDSPIEPRLPSVILAPGEWSDDENGAGPIAAVGAGTRSIPEGWSGARQELTHYATSAIDGSSTWLDLPGLYWDDRTIMSPIALSPDGRWIGWSLNATEDDQAGGWAVKDTVSGEIRTLTIDANHHWSGLSPISFSGDSDYLLTTHSEGSKASSGGPVDQLVAWDLASGERITLAEGKRANHHLGRAPEGVVWVEGNTIFRVDPETSQRESFAVPRQALFPVWSPDESAIAYLGQDARADGGPAKELRLYVGATPDTARPVDIDGVDLSDGESLAWIDSDTVVLAMDDTPHVVDLRDGYVKTPDLLGPNEGAHSSLWAVASDLWTAPMRQPVAATGLADPRMQWKWAGFILLVGLVGAGALVTRRVRAARAGSLRYKRRDRPPLSAWALAWLILAGFVALYLANGVIGGPTPLALVLMLLHALAISWVASGVLRGRRGRVVLTWVALVIWAVTEALRLGYGGPGNAVALVSMLAAMIALGVFCRSEYFTTQRARPSDSTFAPAPVLLVAVVTGCLSGVTIATPYAAEVQVTFGPGPERVAVSTQ